MWLPRVMSKWHIQLQVLFLSTRIDDLDVSTCFQAWPIQYCLWISPAHEFLISGILAPGVDDCNFRWVSAIAQVHLSSNSRAQELCSWGSVSVQSFVSVLWQNHPQREKFTWISSVLRISNPCSSLYAVGAYHYASALPLNDLNYISLDVSPWCHHFNTTTNHLLVKWGPGTRWCWQHLALEEQSLLIVPSLTIKVCLKSF